MYELIRTDKADESLNTIIMTVAYNFDVDTALQVLSYIESEINKLADFPYLGVIPKRRILKIQGMRVLIVDKTLAFYEIIESEHKIVIHYFSDSRQENMRLIL